MYIMKIAQLKASPCLTPLSIFIDSLAKPLIRILAVILLGGLERSQTNDLLGTFVPVGGRNWS